MAAVLAEHQELAVRRIGDAAIAAGGVRGLGVVARDKVLQDLTGEGVEHLHGLGRAQSEDGGAVGGGFGVDRHGLGADPEAQVDLGAGRRDYLAVAHDKGAVRLWAGDIGRKLNGTGERRGGKSRRDQAGQRTKAASSRYKQIFSRHIRISLKI